MNTETNTPVVASSAETSTDTPATKRPPRKTGKAKVKAKVKAKATATPEDGKLALKSICSQLRIEPKKARRILRKAGFSWHDLGERWRMTDAQAQRVRDTLRPPKKAAAEGSDTAQ